MRFSFQDWIVIFHCMYMWHFIYLVTDIWVVSTFCLLWIMLLWTWLCKYLLASLSVLLDGYPEVELLGHIIILFLIFWKLAILFGWLATHSVFIWKSFFFFNFVFERQFCWRERAWHLLQDVVPFSSALQSFWWEIRYQSYFFSILVSIFLFGFFQDFFSLSFYLI